MPPLTPPDGAADAPSQPRYLHRVDLRAALAIAAVFNVIVGIVFALAGLMVIVVATQRGVLDQVNTVTADLGSAHPAHVSAAHLAFVWLLIVAGWTVVATGVVGLAVVILNGVLRVLGGVELDLRASAGPRPDIGAQARRLLVAVRAALVTEEPVEQGAQPG